MPATLLAVDDSVTMRKVLEMTFAGEDFRVVTADNADAALALARSENPALVLADISLPGKSGYDLCGALKREQPGLPVLLLSSKLNPYDAAKGQAAKADDHMDKPFDTQKLIEKVAAMLSGDGKPVPATVQGPPKPAQPAPYRAPANLSGTLVGSPPQRPAAAKPAPVVTPSPGAARPAPVNLRATADFAARPAAPASPSAKAPTPPAAPAAAAPHPVTSASVSGVKPVPKPAPAAHAAPIAPAAPAAAVASAVASAAATGDMAGKLAQLGLSKEQVQAVLALSHDVVERVVWEVVPVLAETLIKEEIRRLTAE